MAHISLVLGYVGFFDPQQARIVELRFFAGLSVEETAHALSISDRTVKREWAMAKAWFQRELQRSNRGSEELTAMARGAGQKLRPIGSYRQKARLRVNQLRNRRNV